MNTDSQPELAAILKSAQQEQVILVKSGKPAAVLTSLKNYDAEDFRLAASEEFWELIESRRRETKGIPLADLKVRLGVKLSRTQEAPRSKRTKKTRTVKARS